MLVYLFVWLFIANFAAELKRKHDMSKKQPDFEYEFTMRYFDRRYLIKDMRAAIGVQKLTWADLTKVNLVKVAEYLKSTHAANSARTLAATIKAFLNIWCEDVNIPCRDFAKVLSLKKVPSQQIALTEDEVRRIDAYEPRTQVESDIKTLAMREIYCGARGSDVELMTEANIVDGEIVYVAKKTKRQAAIPMGAMFKKYMDIPVSKSYRRFEKNDTLKRICRNCGITEEITLFNRGESRTAPKYKFVGFHTLRRTFATILASKGVPVTTIQQWMTHATPMQTARYINTDMRQENKKYAALFS